MEGHQKVDSEMLHIGRTMNGNQLDTSQSWFWLEHTQLFNSTRAISEQPSSQTRPVIAGARLSN